MSYNGSGVFTRLYSWVDDRDNGVKIRADRFDAELDGIATGLSTAILKDGTQTITADIPWGGNKITGLGDPTSAQDAATKTYVDTNFQPLDAALTSISDLTLANGDILYVSGGAITNLAKGTDSQLLTLSSGLPTWADFSGGGWTLINETVVSVDTAAVEWTSIASGYIELWVEWIDAQHDNAGSDFINFQMSHDNGSNYTSSTALVLNSATCTASDYATGFVHITKRENTSLIFCSAGNNASTFATLAATAPAKIYSSNVNSAFFGIKDGELIDAIKLTCYSAANIAAGTFRLWGR